MLSYCRAKRIANTTAQRASQTIQTSLSLLPTSQANAILAQARGFTNFTGLSTARRTVSLPSVTRSSSGTPAPSTPVFGSAPLTPILPDLIPLSAPVGSAPTPPTEAEKAALEAEEHAHDLCAVRNELHRYKEEPLFAESIPMDLVGYWDVSVTECLLVSESTLSTLNLYNRNQKEFIHLCSVSHLTYYQSRPLLFLVNVHSRRAKKHVSFGEVYYPQARWKYFKF